jgi:hypothetical protein
MKNFIFASILLISSFSCNHDNLLHPTYIYKTKGDYLNYYCCILKKDNIHIGAMLDPTTKICRIKLTNDYVYNDEGLRLHNNNIAFLNLTNDNYKEKFDSNVLGEYIIDKDPFIELYLVEKYNRNDTVKLNEIIRKGELEKYFERMK